MKLSKILIASAVVLLSCFSAMGQGYRTLVSDDFSQGLQGKDLSLNKPWGDNPGTLSAFEVLPFTDSRGITLNGLTMTPQALRWYDWHTDSSLKMLNSIDYEFTAVDRLTDTLKIEWHCSWDTLTNGGEAGRINVIVLHDYPTGGPQPGWVDSVQIKNAFGRPAYHLRIVARSINGGYQGFMGYGGGDDTLGELYRFPYPTPQRFWTPGAVPGSLLLPPRGDYPGGQSVNLGQAIAGKREWRTFTFTLYPQQIELAWRRYGEPEQQSRTVLTMKVPFKAADTLQTLANFAAAGMNINRLPMQYNWYRFVSAVRFYGVGVQKTRWGGVEVKATQNSPFTSIKAIPSISDYYIRSSENSITITRELSDLSLYTSTGKLIATYTNLQTGQQISLPRQTLVIAHSRGKKPGLIR